MCLRRSGLSGFRAFGARTLGAAATAVFFAFSAYGGEIVVVVNEKGPLANISESNIKEIYLGNINFIEGVRVAPFHYYEVPVKEAFLERIVGKRSKDYRLHWTRKTFQTGLKMPASAGSADIIDFVEKNPGAIAYLPSSKLVGARGLRVIATVKP